MQFKDVVGQEELKSRLIRDVDHDKISHAQLFLGKMGHGGLALALAYVQYIFCQNKIEKDSCGVCPSCRKISDLQHPDLHFSFPVVQTLGQKSDLFIKEWRELVKETPYFDLTTWTDRIDEKGRKPIISMFEAQEIVQKLSLMSFEGGYKVVIIWMAEKMNIEASNKLLKLLEEPTDKTLLLLVAENEKDIIQTILSRCQVLHFNGLSESNIAEKLITQFNIDQREAKKFAHQAQGNFNKALKIINENGEDDAFEEWFVEWVRAAFRAKGNASAISDLIKWSETIAGIGRETQKKFLNYCIEMFRQALLINYQTTSLVYLEPKVAKFKLENFAPFVNGTNIEAIFAELSDAIYHIERNGNAKIILTDLSIKLTRLIHKK